MKIRLIREMPLIGHANTLRKDDDRNYEAFHKTSRKLINKPRVLEKLSQVLSRHDINFVIIFGGTEDLKDNPQRDQGESVVDMSYQDIADMLGIQWIVQQGNWLSTLKNSIVVIITGDSAGTAFNKAQADTQHALTPWIILHQIGEIFSELYGVQWMGKILSKHIDSTSGKARRQTDKLYHQLFKFGSVRTANKTGWRVADQAQELVAEYLWHGKIRVNQVEGVDSQAIKKEIEDYIKPRLKRMVGGIYRN